MLDRFTKVLVELQSSEFQKDSVNPHFKNRYASLGAHQDLVFPVLIKHGFIWRQSTQVVDNQLELRYAVVDVETGEAVVVGSYLVGSDIKPQEYGSAITYARRYVLSLVFFLFAEDDDGNAGSGIKTTTATTAVKPTATKGKLF